MPRLNRNGVEIYFEVHGKGPALLLTHGFSATAGMWRDHVGALSRDHTVLIWDMRGHGRTDYPEDPEAYSEALTVGDMAALLDWAGAGRAIVGGLSLGGYMSLAFHRAHPSRVKALLIISSGPGFKKDEAREAWNQRAFAAGVLFEKQGLAALESFSQERATARHRSAEGLVGAARGMLTQRDARIIESLPGIQVPSLIIAGSEDALFLAASEYMANKIPGARLVVIPGAGHAVNMDQPKAFMEAVQPFLDSLRPTEANG